MTHVSSSAHELLEDISQKLLRRVVVGVHEGRIWFSEFIGVLVQRIVCQVHVHVPQIHIVWLFIVLL